MDSTPPNLQGGLLQPPVAAPMQKNLQGPRPQFMPRGIPQQQWRGQMPQTQQIPGPSMAVNQAPPTIQQSVRLYQVNLQPAPPIPPEIIKSEQDQRMQIQYEQWLETQNLNLQAQLNYYEIEIKKLRSSRKTLNTKQRQMKKTGSELSEQDMRELNKIQSEQQIIQKQLDNARKQCKQHTTIKQDYESKKLARMAPQQVAPQCSPAHMAPQSPLMQHVQSPHPQMMPGQSPLQSPSPLMAAHSPGPGILQSPGGNHGNSNSAMSPYNTMSQSPRIGTPHSQTADDTTNPFSPNMNPG